VLRDGPSQQDDDMKRREFVSLLGSGAAVWPLAAWAQKPAIPVIGFINGTSPEGYGHFVAAFRRGLAEAGYVEGQNVAVEYRWAEGHYERLQALAADLVDRRVAVIVATSTPANLVAKKATAQIPIVFTTSSDPVELGLVASLDRPGGNVTGAVTLNVEVVSKRLELLHELVPTAGVVAALVNPINPNAKTQSRALEAAARIIGVQLDTVSATTASEIDAALAQLAERHRVALLVDTDAFLFSRRAQLVDLTKRYAMSTIFDRREYAEAGGLVSYGGSVEDVYRLAGIYTARILKGEKPADLPVVQSTALQLIVNLKTANALGIAVPASLLARADEVIE
jgi:putative ABC transport system substrate-binding protein